MEIENVYKAYFDFTDKSVRPYELMYFKLIGTLIKVQFNREQKKPIRKLKPELIHDHESLASRAYAARQILELMRISTLCFSELLFITNVIELYPENSFLRQSFFDKTFEASRRAQSSGISVEAAELGFKGALEGLTREFDGMVVGLAQYPRLNAAYAQPLQQANQQLSSMSEMLPFISSNDQKVQAVYGIFLGMMEQRSYIVEMDGFILPENDRKEISKETFTAAEKIIKENIAAFLEGPYLTYIWALRRQAAAPVAAPAMLQGIAHSFVTRVAAWTIRYRSGGGLIGDLFLAVLLSEAIFFNPIIIPLVVLLIVAVSVLVIFASALGETRLLWEGYDWKKFVAAHPLDDQLYIDSLKSKLDFSSNPNLSFWSSFWNHVGNNLIWFFTDKRKLAMVTTPQDPQKKRERIIAALIIAMLLFGLMLIYLIFILNRGGNLGTSTVICNNTSFMMFGPVAVFLSALILLAIIYCKFLRFCRAALCRPVFIRWKQKFFNKVPCGMKFNGAMQFLYCQNVFLYILAQINLLIFLLLLLLLFLLFLILKVNYKKRLYLTAITITVTIVKIIIRVKTRQIILSIVSMLRFSDGVLLGFIDLEFFNVCSFDIDYTVSSYQYSMFI